MRINTKCSIALHCLVVIFEFSPHRKVTSEFLAKSTGCNAAAIRSILLSLQKANIISVVRGIGGATLAQAPSDITMWEIYKALEPDGLDHLIGLHPSPSKECPVGQQIHSVLTSTYQEIGLSVQRNMKEITVQQIIDQYHQNRTV